MGREFDHCLEQLESLSEQVEVTVTSHSLLVSSICCCGTMLTGLGPLHCDQAR